MRPKKESEPKGQLSRSQPQAGTSARLPPTPSRATSLNFCGEAQSTLEKQNRSPWPSDSLRGPALPSTTYAEQRCPGHVTPSASAPLNHSFVIVAAFRGALVSGTAFACD